MFRRSDREPKFCFVKWRGSKGDMHNSDFQVGYRSNDTINGSYLVAERVCANKLNAGDISGRKCTLMWRNELFSSFASFRSPIFSFLSVSI